jgi:hypothetical protein
VAVPGTWLDRITVWDLAPITGTIPVPDTNVASPASKPSAHPPYPLIFKLQHLSGSLPQPPFFCANLCHFVA